MQDAYAGPPKSTLRGYLFQPFKAIGYPEPQDLSYSLNSRKGCIAGYRGGVQGLLGGTFRIETIEHLGTWTFRVNVMKP